MRRKNRRVQSIGIAIGGLLLTLLSGCASATANIPLEAATATFAEAPPELILEITNYEIHPNGPVKYLAAVYDPTFWEYPWKNFVATESESRDGWTWFDFVGYAWVEYEYTAIYQPVWVEHSSDLKNWRSARIIDSEYVPSFYDKGDWSRSLYKRKIKVPLIVNPNDPTDNRKQFFRLNYNDRRL